jgi:exopolyphosphatase/guanosine-5'-triphosphate,3'-diphosphate pyrophosphatase
MSEFERIAVIEVGTKGIRLLVVQRRNPPQGMEVLESRGELGNLGEGLDQNGGRMKPENIEVSLDYVRRYLRMAQDREPGRIELVGTEVFRRATNVDEFREQLPKPLSLWILKPEEEAVGSFLAACWGLRGIRPGIGQLVVIDLGGGSLELVGGLQANPPLPLASVSMGAIGTLSLRETWLRGARTGEPEQVLRQYVAAEIAGHAEDFAAFRGPSGAGPTSPTRLLVAGLGSTVTDSAWVMNGKSLNRYKSKDVNGLSASRPNLQRLRDELLKMSGLREPPSTSLSHGIKDMLGHQLGLAALLAVMDALGVEAITACGTGLRFGLSYAFLHKIPLEIARADPGK